MEIAERRVATVHFTLLDGQGNASVTTHGRAPLVHMQGTGGIIPALEQALDGKKPGDRFEVEVTPDRGFGPHHPELVQSVPSSMFTGTRLPEVGARLQAQTRSGKPLDVVVTGLDGEHISVDGNHPLAGKTFRLEVEVVDVRLATPEEIQFGVRQPASS